MKEPVVVDNFLNKNNYDKLLDNLKNPKQFSYDPGFGRYCVGDGELPILKELSNKLILDARKIFNSDALMPTYTLFAHYEGVNPEPSLYKHKDDNACTYTLDMCVYQKESWDLYVEDKPYTLYPNQALAYYGNDQMHWREKFPNPKNNYVAMIFFHFAEPEHWYFTKGADYIKVVRGELTEDEWNNK